MLRSILLIMLCLASVAARADIRVFACEPEWAALAHEIGKDKVKTDSAVTAFQDPHYLQAKPSLIAKLRRADLLVCSGAQLEVGWLPVLLQKANNRKVQAGSPGYFEASSFVKRLDVNAGADRSQGDVHPQGNPHVQTSAPNIRLIAQALGERMAQIDGGNADYYMSNLQDFLARWDSAITGWEAKAAPLRGRKMITHHKSWVYLQQWLGIEEVANLEPVPGLPPTTSHLGQLLSQFGDGGADFIVRAPFQDQKGSKWLSDRSGIPYLVLPFTIGGDDRAVDLFTLFDDTIDLLLEVIQ